MAKPVELVFEADATLDQALAVILRAALQHFLDKQPAAEDGLSPEGIHQYRVALRHLRSALGIMWPFAASAQLGAFREDAKWLMSELNEARDWDVFVTDTLPIIAQACPSIDSFDPLSGAAQKQRMMAHGKARAAITDPRTGRFQIALGQWVEQQGWRAEASPAGLAVLSGPARSFAAEMLGRLNRKALKRGRRFRKLAPEERHKLRIALKRLRYAAKFFLPLLGKPKRKRRYARTLSALQDRLGRYNDMAVTARLLEPIIKDETPVAVHRAAGAVLGWQAGRLSLGDAALEGAWNRFRNAKLPF